MPMKPETILGLSRKFMESRIFLTAAELNIFSLLIKHPMSAQEIADKIQVHYEASQYCLMRWCLWDYSKKRMRNIIVQRK